MNYVARFFYRHPADSGWGCSFAMTATMPISSADRLVREWNRRDKGRLEWRHEESLPGDIDYPKGAPCPLDSRQTTIST